MFDDADPEMQQAYENARGSFRYFWRELSWERRRIVPGLDLACVKAPFSDGEQSTADRVVPEPKKGGGLLKNWFGKGNVDTGEHPMSISMAPSFKEQLEQDPSLASQRMDGGWTFLHQETLAGNLLTVQVLLNAGADPNAVTDHGMTPLQLARSFDWDKVVALLLSKGAR